MLTVLLEYITLFCNMYLTSKDLESVLQQPMHLSMSCPTPRQGGGNTGDLTKSSVKFPSTGAKELVQTPLCPHLNRAVSIGI